MPHIGRIYPDNGIFVPLRQGINRAAVL